MPLPEPARLLLPLLLALGGCATSSLELAAPRADRPWNPPLAADGRIAPGPALSDAPDYTLPPNPEAARPAPADMIAADHVYTLPELIDLAQSSNPRTRIAWNTARNAALATGIVRSLYLPQLAATAMGGLRWGHGGADAGLGGASETNHARGAVGLIWLQWLLFDFGGKQARVEAAEQTTIASNIALTAVHQLLIQEVSLAYYQYDAARQHVVNARQGLSNAGTLAEAANARWRHGQGTVVEVAQAAQNREQAKLALITAQGREQDNYLALITAMGISPLAQPRIAPAPPARLSPALEQPVERIVSEALARRPDVLAAYAAVQAEQARARAAETDFLPKIFVAGATSHSSGQSAITAVPAVGQQAPVVNLDSRRSGANVILGITVPLYDGGLRQAVRMQARNDAASAGERLENTRQEATRQIVAAQNALRTSLAANEAAQSLVKAARTTYEAALAAYRNGVGTLTEATLAQSQMLAAQNAYADSVSAARSAAVVLTVSMGRATAER